MEKTYKVVETGNGAVAVINEPINERDWYYDKYTQPYHVAQCLRIEKDTKWIFPTEESDKDFNDGETPIECVCKVIATIQPYKIEGLPMIQLPGEKRLRWVKACERLPKENNPESLDYVTKRFIGTNSFPENIWKYHNNRVELEGDSAGEIMFTSIEWLETYEVPIYTKGLTAEELHKKFYSDLFLKHFHEPQDSLEPIVKLDHAIECFNNYVRQMEEYALQRSAGQMYSAEDLELVRKKSFEAARHRQDKFEFWTYKDYDQYKESVNRIAEHADKFDPFPKSVTINSDDLGKDIINALNVEW